MITLIAESKTMSSSVKPINESDFQNHSPILEKDADYLMDHLRTLSPASLSQMLKISPVLASRCFNLVYDFPNKTTGLSAMEAFTGEVFRAFDFKSLDEDAKLFSLQHIGMISSAYGILFPDNIIKPYRLDFNCKGIPGNTSLTDFWKGKVTDALISRLKDTNEKEIINMLPADASKYIDWKIINDHASVSKPDFKIVDDNGNLKTPHSGKIKELRGQMLRTIVESGMNSLKNFENLITEKFAVDKDLSQKGNPLFVVI